MSEPTREHEISLSPMSRRGSLSKMLRCSQALFFSRSEAYKARVWLYLLKYIKIDLTSPLEKNEHCTRPGREAIDNTPTPCRPFNLKT